MQDFVVDLAPIGLARRRSLESNDLAWMVAYSLARKTARPQLDERQVRRRRRLLSRFARWHHAAASARMDRDRPDVIGVWGGQSVDARAVRLAAAERCIPCVLFETGLLPSTTTADAAGVNAENSVPRDPEFYRSYQQDAAISDRIVPRRRSTGTPEALPQRFVFVPFQVALDSQVLLYSPWIRDMRHLYWLLEATARELPEDLHLVFKPHPNCPNVYNDLRRHSADTNRLNFVENHATADLVRRSIGVVTINSTVGVEALLLERPVLCLGRACYAIPGVADSARRPSELISWLAACADGLNVTQKLRRPFLNWLANEYVIPDSHRAPGPAHFARLSQRLLTIVGSSSSK